MSLQSLIKQSAVSGNSSIQTYQKDGLTVPSAGIEEIIVLSAKNIPQSGFTYTAPESFLTLLLLSLEVNNQSEVGEYIFSKNGFAILSNSGFAVPLINFPATLLLPKNTLGFVHTYSNPVDLTICAKAIYQVEVLDLQAGAITLASP